MQYFINCLINKLLAWLDIVWCMRNNSKNIIDKNKNNNNFALLECKIKENCITIGIASQIITKSVRNNIFNNIIDITNS